MDCCALIGELATAENKTEVLESFNRRYVEACYVQEDEDLGRTWLVLKQAYHLYTELRQQEIRMDKALFVDYLKSNGTMVSGRDKMGRPIVWTKSFKDVYKIKAGSSQESAYIRMHVYLLELGLLRAFPGTEFLVVMDDSHQKLLDFNLRAAAAAIPLMVSLNPAKNCHFYIFGTHTLFRTLWSMIQKTVGSEDARKIIFPANKERIFEVITKHSDIPSWWFNDGSGRQPRMCRNFLWEWDRCLSSGERSLKAKDIFNPRQPWVDIEEEVILETTLKSNVLETVLEDSA